MVRCHLPQPKKTEQRDDIIKRRKYTNLNRKERGRGKMQLTEPRNVEVSSSVHTYLVFSSVTAAIASPVQRTTVARVTFK